MDPITPVIERCEKRLEEVRAILNVWSTMYSSGEINGQRERLQREEMDLVTIIEALKWYCEASKPKNWKLTMEDPEE